MILASIIVEQLFLILTYRHFRMHHISEKRGDVFRRIVFSTLFLTLVLANFGILIALLEADETETILPEFTLNIDNIDSCIGPDAILLRLKLES